ncbi:MAG TPA: hypothetical protein VKV02_05295 [Acidobacteriaceae bacterium]|nr:hypothetical protein [Acidobacteriaceae bacterium]
MSTTGLIVVVLSAYFGLNFLCALVLHLHAERQAHLPVRFLDVLVHFVLLTAFAIPVLLVITTEAMFGGREQASLPKTTSVSHAAARI